MEATGARTQGSTSPVQGRGAQLFAALVWSMSLTLPPSADAKADGPFGSLHIGARLGGAYDSNVYHNANQDRDALLSVSIRANGDLLPSEDVILRLDYRGDLEKYRGLDAHPDQPDFSHTAHLASLTGGYRPFDLLYLSVRAGAEQTRFGEPEQITQQSSHALSFLGAFARASARLEVGELSTLEAGYRYRADAFPNSTLDNTTHTTDLMLEVPLGDYADLRLPLLLEHIRHSERFVQTEQGALTDEACTGNRWTVAPTIAVLPTYSLQLVGTVRGELNDSNGTHYYVGPPPATEYDSASSTLVRRFDAYRSLNVGGSVSWTPPAPLRTTAWARAGRRRFTSRPALDENGVSKIDTQQDTWIDSGVELAWRWGSCFELIGRYAYLRQWSNDFFWDFTRHRVDLLMGTWWDS
jgi:hypothetical protein